MTWTRSWLPRLGLVIVLALNTWLELSAAVAGWADRNSDRRSSSLPTVLVEVLERRPETGDADVHAVMWFVAAVLVLWVVRTWPARAAALVGLWIYSGALELLQNLTSTRSGQWSDLAGNAIGILCAAGVMEGAARLRRRRRPEADRHTLVTESP